MRNEQLFKIKAKIASSENCDNFNLLDDSEYKDTIQQNQDHLIRLLNNPLETLRYVYVQRRTHKNKRINKKWRKRYGWRIDLYQNDELIAKDVKVEIRGTSSHQYKLTNHHFNF